MKILACILFFAASYASENNHFKPGGNDCKNDVVIDVEDSEKPKENLRSCSIEEITTDDVLIEYKDGTVRKTQCLTLEEMLTKQDCLREVLSYLEDADQVAILNTCKSFKKSVLTLYKESIRSYPEIHSLDRILCLSAIEFSFQKSFREEIAENKPRFFTKLHDYVKAKVQRMSNEDYIEKHGLKKRIKFTGAGLKEYEKLTNKRIEIIKDALLQVHEYNVERQKAASRIKRSNIDRCFCFPALLVIFGLYIAFLILPLDSVANYFIHYSLTVISGGVGFFFAMTDWDFWEEDGSVFALIPEKVFRLYKGLGVVTFAAVVSRWFAGRSFVTYILAAIFIGLFYFLPLIFILPRKVYKNYFSKQVEPVEIRKAKKTIQNIQRFFFVDN